MHRAATTLVTCPSAVFAAADAGKVIEISNAGASNSPNSPPLPPHQTFMTTIVGLDSTCGGVSPCAKVDVALAPPTSQPAGTYITWGTDNAPAFQRAGNACPAPSSTNVTPPLAGFASIKGCVMLVPNGGPVGTGDYMFASGVAFTTQTSFEMLGMGNSSKYEQSSQAGVRLVTAMPITILTVNSIGTTSSNYGGFRLENITFRDSSKNGAAIGGLLMSNVSEAVIAYCSFEQFSGQQLGLAPSTTALSYGMRAVAFGGGAANNNIVLLHDKGKDNSIWYDGSDGAQDGPIVFGGDIFPTNSESAAPPSGKGPWTSTCIGMVSTGPIRMYGTHFDVGTDSTNGTNTCVAVYTLVGGIISAKFESSALSTAAGTGIQVGVTGASTGQEMPTMGNINRNASGYATVTGQTSPTIKAGQAVDIGGFTNSNDTNNLGGRFIVTSSTSTSFTYDDQTGTTAYSSATTGTVTGRVTSSLDVESTFNHLAADVTVNSGASNNKIVDYSSSNGGTTVADSGTNDIVQILTSAAAGNSMTFSGTLTVPVSPGAAPSTNGSVAYDSTANAFKVGLNGGTQTLPGVGAGCGSGLFEIADSPTGPTCAQPTFSNIGGSVACSQLPALTGDSTSSAGSCATTMNAKRLLAPTGTALSGTNFSFSSGWGAAASLSVSSGSTDTRGQVSITASGSGIAGNPTITLMFADGAWNTVPFAVAGRSDSSAPSATATSSPTTTTLTITFRGTPTSGSTYTFSWIVVG